MNRYILAFLLAATSLIAVADVQYVYNGRPAWYTSEFPDHIDCHPTQLPARGECKLPNLPATTQVTISQPNGSDFQVIELPTVQQVLCKGNVCSDPYKHPAGNATNPSHYPNNLPYIWFVPQGYYVTKEGIQYRAYKHGTGPFGKRFNLPIIANDEGADQIGTKTYDVWCNPQSDTCTFEGQEVEREKLKMLIPQIATDWCDLVFCYNNSNYDAVVGRDPDGMLSDR